MRVVGAGFGRTGTTSLKAALEKLGFGPSYSLSEVFRNPEHVGFWEAASCPTREKLDWEGFFAGYGVAVDWPACSFYKELMEAFPEALVILTVRDQAEWYESTRSTIYELRRLTCGPLPVRAAFALAGLFAPGVTGTVRLADRLVWEGTFEGRFEDRAGFGQRTRLTHHLQIRLPLQQADEGQPEIDAVVHHHNADHLSSSAVSQMGSIGCLGCDQSRGGLF